MKKILSGLFATEACYMIKEKNKNKKIILGMQVTILQLKIEESLFCFGIFFAGANYHFADSNWENQRQKVWITRHAIECVYMRPEVNTNQFVILLQGKNSLRRKVTSLLAFTWVQVKWNSLWSVCPNWIFKPQQVFHVCKQ